MKILRYSIALLTATLYGYHSYQWLSYGSAVRAITESGISRDGLLEVQLGLIHIALSLLFFIILVSTLREWRLGKVVATIAAFCISAIYAWWYFEKYHFLTAVYGLKVGSPEYNSWLSEIGFFRGATQVDYWILTTTLIVFILVLIWASSKLYWGHSNRPLK